MARTIEVGLAGCGRLGREVMLPLLARQRAVRVAIVADPDPDARAAARAIVPLADVVADWREAIERPGLDAVVVTLPTDLHAEAARAAITRGVALYLEKPLAATLDEGTALLDLWRGTPNAAPVAVGFNGRFHPLVRGLKAGLENGRVGVPRMLRCTFTIAARPDGTWRDASRRGGGVLLDLASHHVDLARWLIGEFVEVGATRVASDKGEIVVATGALQGGVAFSGMWGSGTIDDDVVEVVGSEGALRMSRYEDLAPAHRGRQVPGRLTRLAGAVPGADELRLGRMRRSAPWNDPSFEAALDAFLGAARNRTPATPGLDEGWQSLRVVAALTEAAVTGKRVAIASIPETSRAHV
jgi:myo-inositol 2-dehydrogenase/D-chiro-inositol 1-dehydrogenase